MEGTWYKLDNAAKIYPAIREENWAPIFRIDAILKEEINPEVLQSALIMTYKRFPTFAVNIKLFLSMPYSMPRFIAQVKRNLLRYRYQLILERDFNPEPCVTFLHI